MNRGSILAQDVRAGGSYAGELALAQRYYEKSYDLSVSPATATDSGLFSSTMTPNAATGFYELRFHFKVRKRISPYLYLYDRSTNGGTGAAARCSYYIGTGLGTNQTCTIGSVSEIGAYVYTDNTTANKGGFAFHYVADIEL